MMIAVTASIVDIFCFVCIATSIVTSGDLQFTQLDPVLAHSKAGEEAVARDIAFTHRAVLVFPHGHNEILDGLELPLPVAIRVPAPFKH